MSDIEVKSVEYLRDLATLHDHADEDPACICTGWAADEIKRLRAQQTLLIADFRRRINEAQVKLSQAEQEVKQLRSTIANLAAELASGDERQRRIAREAAKAGGE